MGTSSNGLWDNDAALNAVGTLVKISPAQETMPLLASWGVRLWFGQCEANAFGRGVERKSAELIRLPRPVFQQLAGIAQRPAEYARGSRPAEHKAILGAGCDGYFIAPLFDLPEVKAVVQLRAAALADVLDKTFASKPRDWAVFERKLFPLGVLLTFTRIGLYVEAARVDTWLAGFERVAAAEEGSTEAAARLRPVFGLIKAR